MLVIRDMQVNEVCKANEISHGIRYVEGAEKCSTLKELIEVYNVFLLFSFSEKREGEMYLQVIK